MPEDVGGKVGLDTTDWKTGVSQLNRDIREIESGFRAVAAGMDDWKSSADGLSARQEALSGKINAQKGIVAALEAEYARMKQTAEENGDTTDKTATALQNFSIKINNAKEQLAKSETEYRKNAEALDGLESETGEAEEATKDMTAAQKDAETQSGKLSTALKSVGGYIGQGFVVAAKAAAAAVAAVGAATIAATKQAFDCATAAGAMADNFITLSMQTGVSTETLQKWQYGSNFFDVSVNTMTGAMTKLTKEMGNGGDAITALGVSITDSSGNLRSSEDVFFDCIDALAGIENVTERDAVAMSIFGKSAQELNPLIEAGAETVKALGEEAERMGVVFNEDALSAMGSFDDSMQRFNATGEGLKNAIGLTVIPAFQPLVDTATTCMAQVSTALQDGLQPGEFEELMQSILSAVSESLTGLSDIIVGALPFVTEAINEIVNTVVAMLPGLVNTILPAAMSILQGLIDAILANVDPIVNCAITLITSLTQFLVDNIPTLVTAATSIIFALVDGVTELLPSLIPAAVSIIVQLALALVDAIPELVAKLPEIVNAIIEGLTSVDWIATGAQIITGVIGGLLSLGEALLTAVGSIASTIWDGIINTDWLSLGKNLLNGIVEGMGSLVETVKEKVTGFFSNIWGGVKNFFGIHSPSTVAAEDGKNLMQGFQDGAQDAQPSALESIKGVFSNIWNGIKSIFGFGGNNESAEAKKAGKDVTSAVAEGITGAGPDAENAVKSTAKAITDMFQTALGVASGSSTITKPYGEKTTQGVADGITGKQTDAQNAASTVSAAALAQFAASLGVANGSSTLTRPYGEDATRGIADGITAQQNTVQSAVKTLADGLTGALRSALAEQETKPFGQTAAQGVISGLQGMAASLASAGQSVGRQISDGIAQGIKNGASAITNAAKSAANSALTAAKDRLGIHSPSRVMAEEIGLPAVQGIAEGFTKNAQILKDSVENATGQMASAKVTPVSIPATVGNKVSTTIVNAVLKLREKEFGELVVKLADNGQGFNVANLERREMGVQLA